MSKNYTWEDVPNTLNSISWQLKCIAESLDSINQRQRRDEHKEMDKEHRDVRENSKLRSMLNDL